MCTCYSADHIAEDHIHVHTDITCNIEEKQQKYRLGTVSQYYKMFDFELKVSQNDLYFMVQGFSVILKTIICLNMIHEVMGQYDPMFYQSMA